MTIIKNDLQVYESHMLQGAGELQYLRRAGLGQNVPKETRHHFFICAYFLESSTVNILFFSSPLNLYHEFDGLDVG